jgi:hypothetical protein
MDFQASKEAISKFFVKATEGIEVRMGAATLAA